MRIRGGNRCGGARGSCGLSCVEGAMAVLLCGHRRTCAASGLRSALGNALCCLRRHPWLVLHLLPRPSRPVPRPGISLPSSLSLPSLCRIRTPEDANTASRLTAHSTPRPPCASTCQGLGPAAFDQYVSTLLPSAYAPLCRCASVPLVPMCRVPLCLCAPGGPALRKQGLTHTGRICNPSG